MDKIMMLDFNSSDPESNFKMYQTWYFRELNKQKKDEHWWSPW